MRRPSPDEARWFRRPAASRAWRETIAAGGGSFEARLRACAEGGCVVTFPALPQLRLRGVTCEHARIKAQALVERYLRTLPAAPGCTSERQRVLPLAA